MAAQPEPNRFSTIAGVPSALVKVYLVFCNLSKGNVRYAQRELASR
jgi:hypothetical protein